MTPGTFSKNTEHFGMLVGRNVGLMLCCADVEGCDLALRTLADFLADEIRNDPKMAIDRSIADYRADVGERLISHDRAAWLRALTVAACLKNVRAMGNCDHLILADDDASVVRESELPGNRTAGRPDTRSKYLKHEALAWVGLEVSLAVLLLLLGGRG